jgi:polysaccharide deacetylase family protein (PEP-CTERM system associated)
VTAASAPVLNAFTVDVEDWFQVSAFDAAIDRAGWDGRERRVEANTRAIAAMLERRGLRATFFCLGWVAERCPGLVRSLADAGHEIASHGHEHRLVTSLTPEGFRQDLRRAADAIEAASGVRPTGFRAPSFSVDATNLWAYDVLREEGYRFSSSVFPVKHDRYGMPSFPRRPVRLEGADGRTIVEFPMTTWRVLGRNLPVAGGGWLRFLPPAVMHRAFRAENAQGVPACLYTHPWEVDPGQPRVAVPLRTRFRHYLNLSKTAARLERLLDAFRFGTLSESLAAYERASPPETLRLPAAAASATAT